MPINRIVGILQIHKHPKYIFPIRLITCLTALSLIHPPCILSLNPHWPQAYYTFSLNIYAKMNIAF